MCFSGLMRIRFQWVNLQIPYLNAMCFDEDIMDSLGKLPRTLKATYSQILAAVRERTDREWAVAVRALMWMISSQIPLTQQLWAELTYWPDAVPTHGVTKLLELCRYLVTSNGQSEDVSFAHLSVREYLETEFSPEVSNSMAAECCLSILDSTSLQVFPHSRDDWPELANYAVRYWPDHLDRSYRGMEHMSRPLLDHLKHFLGSSAVPGQSYCRWTSMFLPYYSYKKRVNLQATPPNPLLAACYFKFGEELHDMLACDDLDIESTTDTGETLLHVAINGGNDVVVNILLNAGANPHTYVFDLTSLDLALQGDSMRVIEMLLNYGANHGCNMNILVAAARQKADMSVMAWLIDREPCIKITESAFTVVVKNWDGDEALSLILLARAPYIEINEVVARALRDRNDSIELLLDRNPQTNITEAGLTVLLRSASVEWISKLLGREPPIKITEAVVAVVAAAAAVRDETEILQILLATYPHIKITEAVLAAAVAAARKGYGEQVMRVLLALDPNFEMTLPTVMKLPPLWSRDIVSSLLARVPNKMITERLLLDNIHNNTSVEVMEILLSSFPSICITGGILLAAAIDKDPRMMAILLAGDTNITITKAVVRAAVLNDRCGDRVISMLLNKYPKIEITVALLIAAAMNTGHGKDLLKVLLTRSPDININKTMVSDEEFNRDYEDVADPGNEYKD